MPQRVVVSRVSPSTPPHHKAAGAHPFPGTYPRASWPSAAGHDLRGLGRTAWARLRAAVTTTGGEDGTDDEAALPLFDRRSTAPEVIGPNTAASDGHPTGRFAHQHCAHVSSGDAGVLTYEVGADELPASLCAAGSGRPAITAAHEGMIETAGRRAMTRSTAAAKGARFSGDEFCKLSSPGGGFAPCRRGASRSDALLRPSAERLRDLLTDNRSVAGDRSLDHDASAGVARLTPGPCVRWFSATAATAAASAVARSSAAAPRRRIAG